MSKISRDISNAVKAAKKRNKRASVRALAEYVSKKLNIKISKSTVSEILKQSGLSSPKGRRVSGKSLIRVSSPWAGYYFFRGADRLLGLSHGIAMCFRRSCPWVHISEKVLCDVVTTWILAKVIYSVDLSKVAEYDKSEIWHILGRRLSKGSLTRFLAAFNSLQLIKNEIVTEITKLVQDVHYLQFDLEDGSHFLIDGSFKTIWKEAKIPIDFVSTYCNTSSYIDSIFQKNEPVVVFNARPEAALSELLAEFIFALEGSGADKRIKKIQCMSPQHTVVKELTNNVTGKIPFVIGVWPWQYKRILELERESATGYYFNEAFEQKYPYIEDTIRFAQHVDKNEVTLRLIIIKDADPGHARIALFTNMDAHAHPAGEVVKKFVRRFPFFEDGHKDFLDVLKAPAYAEEYPGEEKVLERAQSIRDSQEADEIFSALVDILNTFMLRSFFPSSTWGWSLLKVRELFLKVPGRIRRDYVDDIICNLLPSNDLQQLSYLTSAATRFNELPVFDADMKKMWVRSLPQAGPGTL